MNECTVAYTGIWKNENNQAGGPQPQEQRQASPNSRIPTYDPFARFKDSSRPPDSHYAGSEYQEVDLGMERRPGPQRRGFSKISVFLILWGIFLFIVAICLYLNR